MNNVHSLFGEAVVQWSSVQACKPRVPGSIPDVQYHFGITEEWPKTTQIAAILSSKWGYVYMHLRV